MFYTGKATATPQLPPTTGLTPTPLQGERGVVCLAIAVGVYPVNKHIYIVSFTAAIHITPLSPWRGVGGEAGSCWSAVG